MCKTIPTLLLLALAGCGNDLTPIKTASPVPTVTVTVTATPGVPLPSGTPAPSPSPHPLPNLPILAYSGPQDFQVVMDQFAAQANLHSATYNTAGLSIQFGSLISYGPNVIGLCDFPSGEPRITISPTFWAAADSTQRQLLLFHESGHCLLLRPHRSDLLADGTPASIMYPIILSDAIFNPKQAYYLTELFQNSNADEQLGPGQVVICHENEVLGK